MKTRISGIILIAALAFSCQTGTETEQDAQANGTDDSTEQKSETTEVRIYPKPEIAEFPDAELILEQPMSGTSVEGNEVAFDFMVNGYELGAQTEEARMGLANSDKGQHIHLIIDNDPYSAHYEAGFTKEVETGHHYAIAFLSRSYHESVKNLNAYEVFQFNVGTEEESSTDLSKPALFYSRPKGTYSGEGAKKVLLDFYLHNTSISADGNKVKVIVNDQQEFVLDTWQPYILEGLPMGENKIYLELTDNAGNKLDVPINSITRVFTLEE